MRDAASVPPSIRAAAVVPSAWASRTTVVHRRRLRATLYVGNHRGRNAAARRQDPQAEARRFAPLLDRTTGADADLVL